MDLRPTNSLIFNHIRPMSRQVWAPGRDPNTSCPSAYAVLTFPSGRCHKHTRSCRIDYLQLSPAIQNLIVCNLFFTIITSSSIKSFIALWLLAPQPCLIYLSYLSFKANVLSGISKVCNSHQLIPNLDSVRAVHHDFLLWTRHDSVFDCDYVSTLIHRTDCWSVVLLPHNRNPYARISYRSYESIPIC